MKIHNFRFSFYFSSRKYHYYTVYWFVYCPVTWLRINIDFTQFLPFAIIKLFICVCFFSFCRSRKVDCGMFIRLMLSDDGQSLDVVEMNENHSSHTISCELFSLLPKQRRLGYEDLQHAKTLIFGPS